MLRTLFFGLIAGIQIMMAQPPQTSAELVSLQTIWTDQNSGQPHNAFTDLIRFQDHWYVAFREAQKHHGGLAGKGALRVLRSSDALTWKSVGHFVIAEGDLRDAKLSITPQGELMLNSAIQVYHPDPILHKNFAWFSPDGEQWSDPVLIGEPDFWIWSITWHDGVAYGVGYPTTTNANTRLYKSEDGRHWEVLIRDFYPGNESSIAFKPDDTAVCFMRGGSAIGQSQAPYTKWSWQPTIDFGGPKLIQLSDGRFVIGGRQAGWGTMKLFVIDPATGATQPLIDLPARGDSSYPGLVFDQGYLWCSYYSCSDNATEGGRYLVPTEVRLAKIRLRD